MKVFLLFSTERSDRYKYLYGIYEDRIDAEMKLQQLVKDDTEEYFYFDVVEESVIPRKHRREL